MKRIRFVEWERWQDLLGEALLGLFCAGAAVCVAWLFDERVSAWGMFLAFYLGGLAWSRPTIRELNRRIEGE